MGPSIMGIRQGIVTPITQPSQLTKASQRPIIQRPRATRPAIALATHRVIALATASLIIARVTTHHHPTIVAAAIMAVEAAITRVLQQA